MKTAQPIRVTATAARSLTTAQTETLRACYRARLWGLNPALPMPSRPCVTRDFHGLKGKATQLRALETRGLVTIQETGHGMGACGVVLVVLLTEAGLAAAREAA